MNEKNTRISIDLGNSVFKVYHNKVFKQFNSRLKQIHPEMFELSEAIKINEVCYAVGQGDYVNENFKANKPNLEEFVLYAISTMIKPTEEETKVNLMFTLPNNQLANKPMLKERFQKTFEYTVNSPLNKLNNTKHKITIENIGVVGESIACYYTLQDISPFITILDIGSKTINYATFTDIGVTDLDKTGTLDFGIHDLYNDVITYYKNEKHKTYTLADIDVRIRNNVMTIPNHLQINFIDKIQNGLKERKFYDYDEYNFCCCGGGALTLEENLKDNFACKNITVLSNSIYRNVMGSDLIGESNNL